jgi:hypothetical protein
VLGEVVAIYIDKSLIEDGVYNTALARPILRAGRGGDYLEVRTEKHVRDEAPARQQQTGIPRHLINSTAPD